MTPEETAAALATKEQELADAKKLLADKETELGQAQHTIVDLKKKKDEVKLPAPQQIDVESIQEKALETTKSEIEKFKLEQTKDTFEEILASMASTPEDQEAIRTAYNDSIVKSGFNKDSIKKDLEKAFILANQPKFETTIKELKQAHISKQTQSAGGGSSQQIETKDENLSAEDTAWVNATATRMNLPVEKVKAQLLKNRGK